MTRAACPECGQFMQCMECCELICPSRGCDADGWDLVTQKRTEYESKTIIEKAKHHKKNARVGWDDVREELKAKGSPNTRRLEPPGIPRFLLPGSPIRAVGH